MVWKNLYLSNNNIIQYVNKQNGRNGKLTGLETEPGSPKVSCMGKVLSEKPKGPNQLRRILEAKKAARSAAKKKSKPEANEIPTKTEHKGPGCLIRMARIFCRNKKRAMDMVDESIRLEQGRDCSMSTRISSRDVEAKETVIAEKERDTPVPLPVPGIGGTKRFASGRKVDWNFEVETDNSDEEKERKSLKNDADVKERNTPDNEKDTPVPVVMLGLSGLKSFASGRKVDWNFETENDGGNLANNETKENNKLENDDDGKQRYSLEKENDNSTAVPVFGISVMKKFASGRKLDWKSEIETNERSVEKGEAKESRTLEKHDDNKETDTLEKEIGTQLPAPVLGISMMKRFPSGKNVEWSFEVDADKTFTAIEEKEKKTMKKDDGMKERDALMDVSVPGIGKMKKFASGRKVDWNFGMEICNTEELKDMKTCKYDDDVKVTDTLDMNTPAIVSVPRIGFKKRFASGRKSGMK
jgi:hypothetical protein